MKYLNIVTALCCTTLISIFLSFHQNNTYESYIEIDSKTGRNERSTPRTFILPATPAIADEQERRLVLMSKKEQIQKCMLKLYDLGFKDFDNFEDLSNFKITLSIIKFQIERRLNLSGEFDIKTMEVLKC